MQILEYLVTGYYILAFLEVIDMLLDETGVYLGRSTKMKRRWLRFKEGDANHLLLLGQSGFGKTTFMRALVEGVWNYYHVRGEKVLIIVIERKYDNSKAKLMLKYFKNLDEETRSRYAFVNKYINLLERYPDKMGRPGDFAMSLPAYSFIDVKYSTTDKPLVVWHGVELKAYPTQRIVFKPRRPLELIAVDNGPLSNVVEGHIHYSDIDFETLKQSVHVNSNTNYARDLELVWDVKKVRDPDRVLSEIQALYMARGQDPSKVDRSLANILSIVQRLKEDRLFVKNSEKDFTSYITTDRINIIDFSANSDITKKEEQIIIKLLVDYVFSKFVLARSIPVFIFIDEVHSYLNSHANPASRAIDKILREGRSVGITAVMATQYLDNVPQHILYGAAHIGVVGYLASLNDKKRLDAILPDAYKIEVADFDDYEEYLHAKRTRKFTGWFSWDKTFTERMYFRPAGSF